MSRARITIDETKKPPCYNLQIEGSNLRGVISTYGVKGTTATSNNIQEVASTLGIEAAK